MHHKRLIMVASLLVLASLLLTACPTTPPTPETVVVTSPPEEVVVTATPPPPPPAEPKTMVICQGQEPDTLYNYGGSMLAASHIQHAIYDGLAWGGGDGRTFEYQPNIVEKLPNIDDGDAVVNVVTVQEGDTVRNAADAIVELAAGETIQPAGCLSGDFAVTYEGGEVQMDQMVVTFKLKPGITWSDGEPLTADDSVYSFELNGDPDTPAPTKYSFEHTASYEATDELTAVWTGVPGFVDATYFINFWLPMPRHLWQEQLGYSAADLVTAEESSRTPLGWGAFVIKEWVPGDHVTVEKNPNYFRASEGLPKVDSIVFRFTGEDPNPVIAAALAGECDIIDQSSGLDSQAKLLIELEASGQLVPTFVTGTAWEHADFGVNPVESYERPDFFEDARVRQAVAMCIGRQEIIDSLLYGRSVVIHSFTSPDHPMYAEDVKQWPDDPAAGMALLDEIGWVDDDGDPATPRVSQGVEGIADGTALSFKWQSTTAELRRNYMAIVQQNLAECGIEVTLENLPAGEYFADGPDGPLFGRHFDIGSFTWLTGVVPSCELYITAQIPSEDTGWSGQNNPGWSNADYDAACQQALGNIYGTDAYVEAMKQAQRVFAEELPVVPLFLRLKLAAYRPEVTGFIVDPTENSEMWNIENFDLSP